MIIKSKINATGFFHAIIFNALQKPIGMWYTRQIDKVTKFQRDVWRCHGRPETSRQPSNDPVSLNTRHFTGPLLPYFIRTALIVCGFLRPFPLKYESTRNPNRPTWPFYGGGMCGSFSTGRVRKNVQNATLSKNEPTYAHNHNCLDWSAPPETVWNIAFQLAFIRTKQVSTNSQPKFLREPIFTHTFYYMFISSGAFGELWAFFFKFEFGCRFIY